MTNINQDDRLQNLIDFSNAWTNEEIMNLDEESIDSFESAINLVGNNITSVSDIIRVRRHDLEILRRRHIEEESSRVDTIEELIKKTRNSMQRIRIERCLTGIVDAEKEFFVVGVTAGADANDHQRTVTIRGAVNVRGNRSDYRVTIQPTKIKCSCPDATHACRDGNLVCKHVAFILLRVGRLLPLYFFNNDGEQPRNLSDVDNERLLKILDDRVALERFYVNNMVANSVVTNTREAFVPKLVDLGDVCPICYEDTPTLIGIVSCPQCHNTLHGDCMKVWINAPNSTKTCVLCRWDGWKYFKG